MKTSSIPSLRVDPDLRKSAQSVLSKGESLSAFVEHSIRECVDRRLAQREFIARGLASRDEAQRTGKYVSASVTIGKLEKMLLRAKTQRASGR